VSGTRIARSTRTNLLGPIKNLRWPAQGGMRLIAGLRQESGPTRQPPIPYPERAGMRGRGRDSRASGGALAVARLSPLQRWRRSSLRGAAPSLRRRGSESGPPAVAVPCPPPWRRSRCPRPLPGRNREASREAIARFLLPSSARRRLQGHHRPGQGLHERFLSLAPRLARASPSSSRSPPPNPSLPVADVHFLFCGCPPLYARSDCAA
jgi:hypothetical protein